jgi:hypothetical protein
MKPGINIIVVEGSSKPYCSISYGNKGQYGGHANPKTQAAVPVGPVGL